MGTSYMDQKLHGHPDHNVVTMEMLHCHMFSLSLGNIVMSVDNGRNEPYLYVPCQLHALFSLLSISHDYLHSRRGRTSGNESGTRPDADQDQKRVGANSTFIKIPCSVGLEQTWNQKTILRIET